MDFWTKQTNKHPGAGRPKAIGYMYIYIYTLDVKVGALAPTFTLSPSRIPYEDPLLGSPIRIPYEDTRLGSPLRIPY